MEQLEFDFNIKKRRFDLYDDKKFVKAFETIDDAREYIKKTKIIMWRIVEEKFPMFTSF